MNLWLERELASAVECAGCGIPASDTFSDVFCPDCGSEHAFCAECAPDAVEALAA